MRLRRIPRDVARWLAVGLLLRESFSFWTAHPFDSEIWIRNAFYVAHGWTPYMPLPPVPGLSFAYTGQTLTSVAYLPLWSLLLAGLYQLYALFPGASRFVLYFLIKQPPILGDTLLGALLFAAASRWGATRPAALRLLAFWMLFPYPILIAAVWGMFDSLVACLILAALLVPGPWKRSGYLGLGILLKLLPVIFVPYEFFRARGRGRWAVVPAFAIPAAFTAAAFALTGWGIAGFTGMLAWESHVAPQGMTPATVLDSPLLVGYLFTDPTWVYLLGYAWIPGVLLGGWWAAHRFAGDGPQDALQAYVFLTVVLFLLRWQVNEQYLVEFLPLLLLDVVLWHPERRGLFRATWVLGLAFLVLNNFLLVRFTAPVYPGALPFESALGANPVFSTARLVSLIALGTLFFVHLLQVAAVVANPRRNPTPWTVLALRRAWSASRGWVRSVAAGRGG